ncbi:Sugar phosphate isomerase/epimerase [Lachnospiraceae bacterium]|nr:Sugar phosphate isomerase/epimerase [Lachnospiraceae bacterium]
MNILLNSTSYIDRMRPNQGVGYIGESGFQEMLLNFNICSGGGEYVEIDKARKNIAEYGFIFLPDHPDQVQASIQNILDAFQKNNLRIPAARATELGWGSEVDKKGMDLYMSVVEEQIRLAVRLGCRSIIVQPLDLLDSDKDAFELNRNFYLKLADVVLDEHEKQQDKVKRSPMKILLENQCKHFEGHLVRGILSDPAEINEWLDKLNGEAKYENAFGFCMNIGNCNLCSQDMYEFAMALKGRVDAVWLSDNDGNYRDACIPFSCISAGMATTNWLEVIRGLRSISFDGDLILDIGSTAYNFPLTFASDILRLTYHVADYLRWQIGMGDAMKKYDHVVLFGAGNMCRNYMLNYGDEFPPLFTCDNNSARWGEDFCGLTIESPEKLKNLPENTGIFICNIYYREIEQQLRDMGIKENIEYFNDQYLQTSYMDRLKGL